MPVRAWGQAGAALALVMGAAVAPLTTVAAVAAELPPAPLVGVTQTGPGGAVRIPVHAPAGTTVEVRAGNRVVATAYSDGGVQWLAFSAATGPHRYLVTTTETTGVVSRPTSVTVEADATPPGIRRFRLTPGTPVDARTRFALTTEAGAAYSLTVDGLPVDDGTTRDGTIETAVLLPDGPHVLSVGLVDAAGNQRFADRTFEVAVPRLRLAAELLSGPEEAVQVVEVTGTPGATATVTVPGSGTRRVRLARGTGRARFELADGGYPAPRIRLEDGAGRRGAARLAPFTVDTAPPRLAVQELGSQESWRARVAAEPGSQVTWQLRDGSGDVVADGSWTAGSDPHRIEVAALDEGGYDATVTATDGAGNTTTRGRATTVSATPLGAGEVAAGAGSILLLVIGLSLLSLVLSAHREKAAARREREALRAAADEQARQRAAAARRHAAEVAAYQERLVDFETATLTHEQDVRVWEQRREHLADLLQRARLDRGIRPTGFTAFKLRAWEQVYCTVPGSMVEVRNRQGSSHVTVVDDGDVTVTSDRVVFSGFKRREWSLAHLEAMEHVGTDRTMMKVSNRKTWSGVTYADPAHTRLCIALAASDQAGSRDDVVSAAERALVAHEAARPVPPAHPGPPPTRTDHAGAGPAYRPSASISAAAARAR